MASRDVTLLNSLIGYVLDVKPYHTKIKEFLSELFFSDKLNVNVTDTVSWGLYHQNVWTRDDVGGYNFQRLCEGYDSDKKFRIPAAVWPRWSITDNELQTPLGDDPAVSTGESTFDFSFPNSSHFLGSDHVDGNVYRYRVPFHQGSRVYIDSVRQTFGVDYIIDATRSFIEFAVAPGPSQHIEVQLMKVDRLFIAYNYPFDYGVDYDFDGYGYDILPYDSSESNPGSPVADFFEFTVDSTRELGYQPPSFFNTVPNKFPKAELQVLGLGSGNMDGETWRITAIGPWNFKVQKLQNPGYDMYGFDETSFDDSISPETWFANFKEIFDNGQVSFLIDRVWCNYYLVPDNDSYDLLLLDDTDFLPSLELITEHGVITDPTPDLHRPMEFIYKRVISEGGYDATGFSDDSFDEPDAVDIPSFSIGKVKKFVQNLIPGPLEYYVFELTDVPVRGTYVELRIEQNGQLNPWLNAIIRDDMYIRVNYVSPVSSKFIHNVNLIGNEYVELAEVDELVLYHGRDVFPTSITVTQNGSPLSLPATLLVRYFEGTQLPPNTIGFDKNRVIINLATAQAIEVSLTFA